jgi:hypothetical protein
LVFNNLIKFLSIDPDYYISNSIDSQLDRIIKNNILFEDIKLLFKKIEKDYPDYYVKIFEN